MTAMERVARCGVVPVIVLEDVARAVPTAGPCSRAAST